VAVDAQGTPLVIQCSGANLHDSKRFVSLIEALPAVPGQRGRPRCRPEKVHADKGYDYPELRRYLQRRGIKSRIARRGVESKQHLGRHRWVVERTLSWLNRYRKLRIRYERRADMHMALLTIACALISWRAIERFC
jgi:IS5 family transposase